MPDPKANGIRNYTTTGTKSDSDLFSVSPCDTLTIAVTVNTGPAVYDIEVRLQTGGNWYKVVTSATTTAVYKINARIAEHRLVIGTLGGGSIDYEAVAAARGNS